MVLQIIQKRIHCHRKQVSRHTHIIICVQEPSYDLVPHCLSCSIPMVSLLLLLILIFLLLFVTELKIVLVILYLNLSHTLIYLLRIVLFSLLLTITIC